MYSQLRMRGVLGLVLLMAGVNAAWALDYTNTAAGNWNAAIWSSAGYPGQNAGDTATFAGAVGRTVTLTANPANALDAFSVTGGGAWTLGGYIYTLAFGAGNLNYSGSNTLATLSSFEAKLAGTGGVRMNSGALRLGGHNVAGGNSIHTNVFSGDVEINGGVLLSGHSGYETASGRELGRGSFILGSASPGSDDATLLLMYGATYTNPLTIRANNSGVARLGRWGTGQDSVPWAALSGSITLQKDLTIVNDESGFIFALGGREKYYPFNLSGPIVGTGNVTKEGVGNVYLQGANSYRGSTTLRGGTLYIEGPVNSNTGNFVVAYGALIAQTNESLGNLANRVTLGANGTLGEFGCYRANGASVIIPFPRSITLAGNGGILSSRGYYARWQMDGVISGSGRLILANGGDRNSRSYLNGNNLHTGGMIANNGCVDISNVGAYNNTVYGNGDIWVLRAGNLFVRGANNIGAGAKVRIEYPGALSVMTAYVPDITTDSDGIIGFGLTTGVTINDRFASSTPLGNGTMWLGTTPDLDCIFTGSSLAALAANDATHTYRLGRNGYSTRKLVMNASGTAGALKDLGGNAHSVVLGGIRVDLIDDNPFTGTLTVQSGASCYGCLPDATGNPFGANAGALVLEGARNGSWNEKFQVVNSYNATRSVSKGAVSFDGSVGPFSIDGRSSAGLPTWITTVTVASLDRVGRGTLSIDAFDTTLGDKERLTVGGGIPSINGMVAPHLWNGVDGVFLDYGAGNGFTNAGWTKTVLSEATEDDKVNLAAGETLPAGGVSLHALKSAFAIGANGTAVLTNKSGGLILTGNTITHTAPLDFGANEAVVYVTAENTLSGPLTGSGGLTKSGTGTLKLRADNTRFTGGFTVNEGTLDFAGGANLGGAVNTITLNGGALNATAQAVAITNNIVLGTLGGQLVSGTYVGNISGPGTLVLGAYNVNGAVLQGSNNTYSGGTIIYGTPTLGSGTSLSTGGTVTVQSSGHSLGNDRAVLRLNDAGNLTAAHRLILNSYNSTVIFNSTTPVVGSIEGNGTIAFGAATDSSLRVGGNNRSTHFFGVLVDPWTFSATPRSGIYSGTLVKEGTGTLTLWGESWYRGGTIISNGTLVVNNWMNPAGAVVVCAGATLDGIGTVGIVSNFGGTVKGSLHTSGLVMDATASLDLTLAGTNAISQYGQTRVAGLVNLNGATLVLRLGAAPVGGAVYMILDNRSALPVSGSFANAADGATLAASYGGRTFYFQVNYAGGDGNDVTLTAIPQSAGIYVW